MTAHAKLKIVTPLGFLVTWTKKNNSNNTPIPIPRVFQCILLVHGTN